MQHNENIDREVQRILRKHPAPDAALREELWKGVESALDEKRKPMQRKRYVASGVAALLMLVACIGWWQLAPRYAAETAIAIKTEAPGNAGTIPPGETIGEQNIIGRELTGISQALINNAPGGIAFIGQGTILQEISRGNLSLQKADALAVAAIQPEFSLRPDLRLTRKVKLDKLTENAGAQLTAPGGVKKKGARKLNDSRDWAGWNTIFMNIWDNPAYTGAASRFNFSFDDRMSFLEKGYAGIYNDNFAADARIPRTPVSVGIYNSRSLRSFSLRTETALTLSARVAQLHGGYLSLGGGVSQLSKTLFRSQLHYTDQFDPTFGFIETTRQRDFASENTAFSFEAGAWYQGRNLIGGVSVQNINQPYFGYLESGERMQRTWLYNAGYRLDFGRNLQIMPYVEIRETPVARQASTFVMATFRNKVMLGAGYQNISPVTRKGDRVAYLAVEAFNRVKVFASYGYNDELKEKDINKHLIHTGLRLRLP